MRTRLQWFSVYRRFFESIMAQAHGRQTEIVYLEIEKTVQRLTCRLQSAQWYVSSSIANIVGLIWLNLYE